MFPSPGWDSVPAAPLFVYPFRSRLCVKDHGIAKELPFRIGVKIGVASNQN